MGLFVQDKDIVVPGQELAEGMDYLPSGDVIREKDKLISIKVGTVSINNRFVKVIPLAGKYTPKREDLVIGEVVNIGFSGWRIDFGWAFEGNVSLKDAVAEFVEKSADLTKYYNLGDWVLTQIVHVAGGGKIIDLSMRGPSVRKLGPGRLVRVTPSKVPRIIGKQGSMITLIKDSTNCKIFVGQNGYVWITGEKPEQELLASEAIAKIEAESHISGLTDRMKVFFEEKGITRKE
ncbi:RNA-binding protein [Candidatus Woesearchaeota archaeon]|nr:RNA-binding protein [Candidatus Woesearchaeota archaeon]